MKPKHKTENERKVKECAIMPLTLIKITTPQ